MTCDDGTSKEPRTVSKGTFEILVVVAVVIFSMAEKVGVVAMGDTLGFTSNGSWVCGLTVLNLVLARRVVDTVLKRFGLSRSGKSVEIQGRTVAVPEGEVADGEVVEIRCPSSYFTGLFWMCLLGFLSFAVLMIVLPSSGTVMVGLGCFFIAFFGFGTVYAIYEGRWGKPQAWADSSGITGYPFGLSFQRRFVAWSRVATCEIETYYDTFGKPVIIRPILKGFDNEVLMTMNLLHTELNDQDRLVKYIKAKLPKPKFDDWA